MKSLLMMLVFRINGGGSKLLFCLLGQLNYLRAVCCYYFRVSWSGIILFLFLLKEV